MYVVILIVAFVVGMQTAKGVASLTPEQVQTLEQAKVSQPAH